MKICSLDQYREINLFRFLNFDFIFLLWAIFDTRCFCHSWQITILPVIWKKSRKSKIRKGWFLCISPKKKSSKFQPIISKNEGGDRFLVTKFWVFRKSRLKFARVVYLPVNSRFENAITLARINIFWSGKKHLVAGAPLYQEQ